MITPTKAKKTISDEDLRLSIRKLRNKEQPQPIKHVVRNTATEEQSDMGFDLEEEDEDDDYYAMDMVESKLSSLVAGNMKTFDKGRLNEAKIRLIKEDVLQIEDDLAVEEV